MLNYLLRTNECAFDYMEKHDFEYGRNHVYPVVLEKITALKACKLAFEQSHADGIFDITTDEARYFFYGVRNLIRRGVIRDRVPAEPLGEDLRFLLSIPAVAQLAALSINGGPPNELFRLALTIDNIDAAQVLLHLPAVRQLAAAHDFYRHKVQNGLTIQALAQDRESAMRALSVNEQHLLARTSSHYQPLLEASGGVSAVMASLRKTLLNRYTKNPAQLMRDNQRVVSLPFDWQAFNELTLSVTERSAALKAYYQHASHSAWRYLAKPNPWLHPKASFVYVDEANRQHRWSTFEEYEPLIALLWLAVTDETILSTDQSDVADRIAHFIEELRLIGRAHNWDKTHKINGRWEEFNDLEGDKPSCYSGVKRRLFQTVIGHPLLTLVPLGNIKQVLCDLVLTHFKQTLATATN